MGDIMIFGGFGSRKNSTTPFFVLVVAAILSIWLILLGITLTLTLRYSLSTMQEKIDFVNSLPENENRQRSFLHRRDPVVL